MIAFTHFKFCPSCGQATIQTHQKNAMQCAQCGYVYFHNTAGAVSCILQCRGQILLVKRNYPPKKGYYDLPGGFIDYNESAESALRRELREELELEPRNLKYFCSFPNTYKFGNVCYFTCDMVFIATVSSETLIKPHEEIAEIIFINPKEISETRLAFKSVSLALKQYALNH
jgi:NADH pyrophosphatase NudC (nudix superfamily)